MISAAFVLPVAASAANERKTVRVGWYESSFNTTDKSGRRSGYAYEYQLKLASYTGWKYTYVTGSWADLMQMLIEGKIDLMSDVSYTDERSELMLFPELPMGTEEYFIFISQDNDEITVKDYKTLNGKRIGVNKGSIQIDFYKTWAAQHGVDAELAELTYSEGESLDMLDNKEIDAYITPNAFGDPERLVPVCKIGSSDFFFVVANGRADLLDELNTAMSRIQDENPYYNQRMFEEHVQRFGSNAFLTGDEKEWLASHGAIRVGYQDNYLAFCAKDEKTGELTGALREYLAYASKCFSNSQIDFTATAYPTAAAALEALNRGEIDCVFPSNLGGYDSETQNVLTSPSIIRTDMYAVVRQTEQSIFGKKEYVIVAVNEGNTNYNAFLQENYPGWRCVYFPTTKDCLEAVSKGLADCVMISNYRYNNISRLCDNYHLTTYATGLSIDYCFAVGSGQTELYSILAKAAGLVPTSTVNAALSYYITQDAKLTFSDFIKDNIGVISIIGVVIILLIVFFLIKSLLSEKKAKKLISATETDDLTGLYNRNYFFEYANRIYREHPDTPRDAIVINIDHFHSINALNGWEFGDSVLRALGAEIKAVASERGGISGRFGADRFDIYCRRTSDYQAIYDRLQNTLTDLSPNTSVRLRMGVMPYQAGLEPIQLFDRARTACSMARGHYKEHLIVFDEKVREKELLDQRLQNDLKRAIENYEFEVFYQPKYDISGEEPRLVSVEALIRWQHPELGLIAPNSFIPMFEQNGGVSDIDRYVWSQAARQIARWRAHFGFMIPVSVNLSRVDVFDPALCDTLDEIIAENGLDRSALLLEVTESAYMEDADQVIEVVEKLRNRGYTMEMDDFGTGYSSLNMLSAMPVDVLKMDRTFILNMENSEKDTQLIALILGIAKNLNIPVVAEGVETESQVMMLKDLGCTLVQGYYFSRPLHPSEFEEKILQNMAGDDKSDN